MRSDELSSIRWTNNIGKIPKHMSRNTIIISNNPAVSNIVDHLDAVITTTPPKTVAYYDTQKVYIFLHNIDIIKLTQFIRGSQYTLKRIKVYVFANKDTLNFYLETIPELRLIDFTLFLLPLRLDIINQILLQTMQEYVSFYNHRPNYEIIRNHRLGVKGKKRGRKKLPKQVSEQYLQWQEKLKMWKKNRIEKLKEKERNRKKKAKWNRTNPELIASQKKRRTWVKRFERQEIDQSTI